MKAKKAECYACGWTFDWDPKHKCPSCKKYYCEKHIDRNHGMTTSGSSKQRCFRPEKHWDLCKRE